MPEQDLDGVNIVYSKNMQFDIGAEVEVTEDYIAGVRY
jgi:hypothetical protein